MVMHALNKTHCINGHLFTPSSTYISPKGIRACRICKLEAIRLYRKNWYRPIRIQKSKS